MSAVNTNLSAVERALQDFILGELIPGGGAPITVDEDLIKRGIVDSLGVMQLVDFCESRYGLRVTDADLVPDNFRTVRTLADYVERKLAENPDRRRFPSTSR